MKNGLVILLVMCAGLSTSVPLAAHHTASTLYTQKTGDGQRDCQVMALVQSPLFAHVRR
jgi:hypothetical protein